MPDQDALRPPKAVQAAACRGLKNRAAAPPSKRCCTPTGIARGRDLCAGRKVSKKTRARMASFFARHAGVAGQQPADTKGGQAWDVWGGDPGRRWVRDMVKAACALRTTRAPRAAPPLVRYLEERSRPVDPGDEEPAPALQKAKATPGPTTPPPGRQLDLFGRATPPGQQLVHVQQHVRRDAHGVHVVRAHEAHHVGPQARAPSSPAATYVARGLKALQRNAEAASHPDVARRLRAIHDAVAGLPNPDHAAPQLERRLEALRAETAHPAALLRAAGDRVAEATRTAWQGWRQQVAAEQVLERRERLKDRVEMHDLYQPFGAPRPGERGYQPAQRAHPDALDGRTPEEVAETLLTRAIELREDPVIGLLLGGDPEMYGYGDEDPEDAGLGWTRADLPDLFGVPERNPRGQRYLPEQRLAIVGDALHLAAEMAGEAAEADWWPGRELPRGRATRLPRALAQVIIEDALQPVQQENDAPRIVLVDKQEAAAFIGRVHSKLPKMNARGLMYAIGLRVGGRLVAVATAGSPGGRWKDPHRILDVSRIASDGTYKGASSALMARLMELVDRSRRPGADGPSLLITYSLASEAGTTYKALADKGLRPTELRRGKSNAGGARGGESDALQEEDKILWEYGAGARPARWELLNQGSLKSG